MNALVVGAGTVGQVFARHLHLAGAHVTFLARPGRVAALEGGLAFYPLNRRRPREKPIRLTAFDAVSRIEDAKERRYDRVYVCVPSDALTPDLLAEIASGAGDASIIKIQPGLDDRAAFEEHFERDRIVSGMVGFIAYPAPLTGETVPEPGTAYWFPPFIASRFGGPEARVRQVVDEFRAGGLPAQRQKDVEAVVGWLLAVEAPLTAGLDCAGWSLKAFTRGPWLDIAVRAVHEAVVVVGRLRGTDPPLPARLVRSWMVRAAASAAPREKPLPFEAYLEQHFTRLRSQSIRHLDEYIRAGTGLGLPVEALQTISGVVRGRLA